MDAKELDKKFNDAVDRLNKSQQEFPPDILLKFFALYKRANQNNVVNPEADAHELISAFKMNAILQIKGMSPKKAKKEYIKAVAQYLD